MNVLDKIKKVQEYAEKNHPEWVLEFCDFSGAKIGSEFYQLTLIKNGVPICEALIGRGTNGLEFYNGIISKCYLDSKEVIRLFNKEWKER